MLVEVPAVMNIEIVVLYTIKMIYWLSDQITMHKLILLGLFLSCSEVQNVLGNELLEKIPWDPQPRPLGPPGTGPPALIVEPTPIPPFQDCYDGNKCHWHWQCGKNGKCRDKKLTADVFNWVGYVHLQKFKAHFQSYCLDKKRKCKLFVEPRDNLLFTFCKWWLKNDLHTMMALYHCRFLILVHKRP